MYALLGNKRIPLPACVYHAVRKTFDLHKKELKGCSNPSRSQLASDLLPILQSTLKSEIGRQLLRRVLSLLCARVIIACLTDNGRLLTSQEWVTWSSCGIV